MFVDRAKIHAKAGQGGRGCVSFRREKYIPKGGPDGGPGGDGGSVILQADPETDHLTHLFYQPNQFAKSGEHGKGKQMAGKNAPDLVVKVPLGTEVRDEQGEVVADLVEAGSDHLLCKGGRGGRGNMSFKSSTHQAPREFEEGQLGEEGRFELVLKIVADVGIVGLPNAGKSTLLAKLTNAHPKVAAYPFTTLQPNVGILTFEDHNSLRIADVPGLIEGASQNRGLGHDFLRHVERCRFLLVLLDASGSDNREPWDDYRCLLNELELYRADLVERPRLVVANKMDLPEAADKISKLRRKVPERLVEISADKDTGVGKILSILHKQFFETSVR